MKTDRLLGILTVLLRQGQATAPALADRFEVSRRTINRDIETLCRAGIPLVTRQGYGGGISIAEGYQLNPALFTEDELQALLAGVQGIRSISKKAALSGLLDKLPVPPADDILLIDLTSFDQEPLIQKIALIRQAARERRLLSFRYYYQKGKVSRIIEPYRLIFKWSAWYVLGYCTTREDFRLFKLNRLWNPTLAGPFVPREIPLQTLSLDHYFEEAAFHLKALFSEQESYRLIEEYGPDCYTFAADKRLLLERDFVSYNNMREWVLSFGDHAEVLEPEHLRSDLRQQAENILKKYSET